MWRSWRLGKLFGIPIYLHPTFLLVPVLAVLQSPGGWPAAALMVALVLTVFGCVLLHELGHALMARFFGIGTRDITLCPIGGIARLTNLGNNPREELLIAVAGPAVNVVIALLLTPLLLLAFLSGVWSQNPLLMHESWLTVAANFLSLLWASNIILVLFNMLPAFPMDGGRVLRALLSMGMNKLRATEIAAKVGLVVALLVGLGGLFTGNLMLLVVAGFVVFAGQAELQNLRYRLAEEQPVVSPLDPEPFVPGYVPREPRFSGYTWDARQGMWVKWIDGQPVGHFAGQTR
jgi:Zn-dependent protease